MTWVVILLVALAVFAIMAFVLKMPRSGWELAGAALFVGIAGYALQGHPSMPGAPKAPVENKRAADAAASSDDPLGAAFRSLRGQGARQADKAAP